MKFTIVNHEISIFLVVKSPFSYGFQSETLQPGWDDGGWPTGQYDAFLTG